VSSKPLLGLALLLLIAGPLAGCAQTFDATTLGVPVSMAAPAGQMPEGTGFSITSRAVYGLWGLVGIRSPSLRKALASQLAGGGGIANLTIKVRSRWSDVLITALTAGLIVPRAITFEGVVTK
jgi:hypothetical protein